LPVDHSILNWNDFFPSYLVFQMACVWAEMGFDYLVMYNRTYNWDSEWIKDMGPYSDMQLKILRESINCLNDEDYISPLLLISAEFFKQGNHKKAESFLDEAFKCSNEIDDDWKGEVLAKISLELTKQGKINEALECTLNISEEWTKDEALSHISIELAKQGKFKEAVECASNISEEWTQNEILTEIATELANQGKFDDVTECVSKLSDNVDKSIALAKISTVLEKQGKGDEAEFTIKQALELVKVIYLEVEKCKALVNISSELANQGKIFEAELIIQEALNYTSAISEEDDLEDKCKTLLYISAEFFKQGKFSEADLTIRDVLEYIFETNMYKIQYDTSFELAKRGKITEALGCASGIFYRDEKNKAISDISIELAKNGKIEEALECSSCIIDKIKKDKTIANVSEELLKQSKTNKVKLIFQDTLRYFTSKSDKDQMIAYITFELFMQGKREEAIECVSNIGNLDYRDKVLNSISLELVKQGKKEEALICINAIGEESIVSDALVNVASELLKQEKKDEAILTIQHAIKCISNFSDEWIKNDAFVKISHMFAVIGKSADAMDCIFEISHDQMKSRALANIYRELANQKKDEEAELMIQNSLKCVSNISNEYHKDEALLDIIPILVEQGNTDLALECANKISFDTDRCEMFAIISTELSKQGKTEKAEIIIQDALKYALSFSDNDKKVLSLKIISTELAKQGNKVDALKCANAISDNWQKNYAIIDISCELSKMEKMEEAKSCISFISVYFHESKARQNISKEFFKQGKIVEAIDYANGNSETLSYISTELENQGKTEEAEAVGLRIRSAEIRHSCWKEMAKNQNELNDWKKSLAQHEKFQNIEARFFYLKGWAESITLEEMSEELISNALPFFAGDSASIESLLQLYAIQRLYFHDTPQDKIDRYNQTFNLSWVRDVKNGVAREGDFEDDNDDDYENDDNVDFDFNIDDDYTDDEDQDFDEDDSKYYDDEL
jgi:hypothetical protein